jgi:type I restriction enzyme M protein
MRQDVGVDGDAQRISQLCWMFFLKIIDDQDQELELLDPDYRSPIPEPLRWRAWAADPEGITGDELLAFINGTLFPRLKELSASGKGHGDRRRVVRDVFEDAYNYMKSGQLMRQVINKINGIDFNDLAERQHFGDVYEQVLNDLQSAGNAGEYYTPRAVTAFMAERVDPKPGEILLDPACGTGGFLTCSIRHMRERYVKTVEDEERMQQALRAVEKKQLPHMLCVTNMLLHGIKDPSFVRHDNTLARPYVSYASSDRVDVVLTNPPFGGREEDGIETNFPKHFQTRETADLFLALIIRLLKSGGRAAVVLPDGSLFGEGVKTRLKEHLLEECNLHTIVRLPNSVFKPYASIGTNLLFFEKGEPTKEIWFYEHRVPAGQKAYSMTKPIRVEHLKPCVDWWDKRAENEVAWKVTIDEVKARAYNLDFKNPHTVADDHGDPEELLKALEQSEQEAAALRDQLKGILAEALLARQDSEGSHSAAPQRHASEEETKELLRGAVVAFPAPLVLGEFARVAGAPGSVPRLRRFILDLAVRGKLVEQDANDKPASELLKRIATEIKQTSEGRRAKHESTAKISHRASGVLEARLPDNWVFAQISDVFLSVTDGDHQPPPKADGGIPFLVIGNVRNGVVDFTGCRHVPRTYYDSLDTIRQPKRGDLLYTLVGSYGIPVLVDGDRPFCVQRHIGILRPSTHVDVRFLCRVMESRVVFDQATACATGIAQKTVPLSGLRKIWLPLPPFAEQRRIVAKVDELISLCDRLEAQLTVSETQNSRFLEAVLHETIAAANATP